MCVCVCVLNFLPPPSADSLASARRAAQIGGMASTNCSGTHACRHSSFKANVLGVEAVLADGTVFRAGSRARKTSAGLDLTSLLCGAEGALAIITRLTLRLVPAPRVTHVLVTPFPSARAALKAVAAAQVREQRRRADPLCEYSATYAPAQTPVAPPIRPLSPVCPRPL